MSKSWRIGDIKITRVVEIETPGGWSRILPDSSREQVLAIPWLRPHFADEAGRMIGAIQMFIIEAGGMRIAVDTCLGNDKPRDSPAWNMLQTGFLKDFEAAGFRRDGIDRVLCTHLHVDHVGWNTMWVDGKWVPTFPRARYLLGRTEFEYWKKPGHDEKDVQVMADSVLPVWDAGLVDLVATDHEVCPGVRLMPTTGHTPGHVSIMIESQGQHALITGDFVHHPCQFVHPEWGTNFDFDKQKAIATRREMFAKLADEPTLVIGTHFATPVAGHLKKDGEVWRLEV